MEFATASSDTKNDNEEASSITEEPNIIPTSTANRSKRRARRKASSSVRTNNSKSGNIFKSTTTKKKNSSSSNYRFAVGQCVLCRINNGWARGFVIRHNYREARWPPGETAPYQVRLDGGMLLDGKEMEYQNELDGNLIYAPRDLDVCIRKGHVAYVKGAVGAAGNNNKKKVDIPYIYMYIIDLSL